MYDHLKHNDTQMQDKIRMNVSGIVRNQAQTGYYGLVLEEVGGNRHLRVVIGMAEAHAIDSVLRQLVPPRPLTHDLTAMLIKQFGMTLESILIHILPGGIYGGELYFSDDKERKMIIDARCSDAVALALRLNAPIYADKDILDSDNGNSDSIQLPQHTPSPDSIKSLSKNELRRRLKDAADTENYELAARIKAELDARSQTQSGLPPAPDL